MNSNKAVIISIGDELLIGQVVNSNASFLASGLCSLGIRVAEILTVGDDAGQIFKAFQLAAETADIVIVTGGLGPTKDDITKTVICSFFNTHLVLHQATLQQITSLLSKRNIIVSKLNHDQALVPEGCIVLENKLGTAPGLFLEKDKVKFFFLPGVPFEMNYIFNNHVVSLLKGNSDHHIIHRHMLVTGIPESILAETISGWESSLPENVRLAYLPSPGVVKLRLSAHGSSEPEMNIFLDQKIKELKLLIPDYLVNDSGMSIQETLGNILLSGNYTLSVAESCTGGNIAHLITSVPGCSRYFAGSVVAYDNRIKSRVLKVPESEILEFGAVSKQVVEIMAVNIRKLFKSDFSIATSGIAGPDGGTSEKPVGTTWIAVADKNIVKSRLFRLGDDRERNITRASVAAMDMLIKYLLHA